MKKYIAVLALITAICGCATSSGIIMVGQDTYMVALKKLGMTQQSPAIAKAIALKQADDFCKKHGKVLFVTKTTEKQLGLLQNGAEAEIWFKCLDPNDPANNQLLNQ